MLKNRRSAILLIILFVLPITVYLTFRSISRPVFKQMPYAYMLTSAGDTVIPQLDQVLMYTIDGEKLSSTNLSGKIYIIDFFSPSDTLLTTVLHGNLARVRNNISDADYIGMLSLYTGDSLTNELKAYYESRFPGDDQQWKLAWGSQNDILTFGESQLGIEEIGIKKDSLMLERNDFSFTSQTVALVDKQGRVRKYYAATDLGEIRKIGEDLQALTVLEYPEELNSNRQEQQ